MIGANLAPRPSADFVPRVGSVAYEQLMKKEAAQGAAQGAAPSAEAAK